MLGPTLAATLAIAAPAPAAAMDDSAYLAFTDRMQARIDRHWDDRRGLFSGLNAGAHANVLLTYAVAAREGHRGPARNDRRARRLVDALTSQVPFVATPPPRFKDAQTHAPGFVASMTQVRSNQHLVVDAEIIDGLRYAWLARRALGLSAAQADRIADRIHRTARGAYWRWPTIRLNQISWYATVYAADATVTRDPRMLRHDFRLQLARFADGARGTARAAGNLGPGLHFHYLPHMRRSAPANVDSAEYANITASFAREYAAARAAGMPAPSAAHRELLRRWLLRVLAGYWTHGGYVNWDTGFGFRRWHQAKKLGLSQQALLGIATAPGLAPHPDAPAWAKWMLDRGFAFYGRAVAGRAAPGLFFGVDVVPQDETMGRLAMTRMSSNAARAIAAGLGDSRAEEPPPLYAFDPDTGRLAITTPAYNTAVVPTSRGAFPYGGIELARLYDGQQDVVGGIGGRPPASFGLMARDNSGRRVFGSQLPGTGRLRLTRAPSGVRASASSWTGRAYAGPFTDLRAEGVARGRGVFARTRHRFTRDFVETGWTLRSSGERRLTVDVLFPSWGRGSAVAVGRDGSERRVGAARIPLAEVAYAIVRSPRGAYVVLPRTRPRGATLHALRPARQDSAPNPGPTLAVQLARASSGRHVSFRARVTPVARPGDAAAVAARTTAG